MILIYSASYAQLLYRTTCRSYPKQKLIDSALNPAICIRLMTLASSHDPYKSNQKRDVNTLVQVCYVSRNHVPTICAECPIISDLSCNERVVYASESGVYCTCIHGNLDNADCMMSLRCPARKTVNRFPHRNLQNMMRFPALLDTRLVLLGRKPCCHQCKVHTATTLPFCDCGKISVPVVRLRRPR